MDTIGILSLLSGLIGILGYFYPIEWKKSFVIKIAFSIILLFLSTFIILQNSKIEKIERISKSANLLIEGRNTKFTSEGFILAALSFLEQNKSDFPDAYYKAEMIYFEYNNSEDREMESIGTSFELEGLIRGIAILSTVSENDI